METGTIVLKAIKTVFHKPYVVPFSPLKRNRSYSIKASRSTLGDTRDDIQPWSTPWSPFLRKMGASSFLLQFTVQRDLCSTNMPLSDI